MSVDGSHWYVKLADGDVERVTLDQLDEAFQNGQIDESSLVLAAGSDKWEKLADLLGLSETAPAPAAVHAPAPVHPQPIPAHVAAPLGVAAPAPLKAPAPGLPVVRQPLPQANSIVPPVNSFRPVSVDLGVMGASDAPFRRSSKKRWVLGVLATVGAVGAGALFAARQNSASAASDPAPSFAAAAAALPPPAPSPLPQPVAAPPAPAPAPQAATTGPSSVMDPTQRLSDDTRAKLLDNDKKQQLKKGKAHVATGGGAGGGGHHSGSHDKSTAFTTSGNKYDPLNSSL